MPIFILKITFIIRSLFFPSDKNKVMQGIVKIPLNKRKQSRLTMSNLRFYYLRKTIIQNAQWV